MVVCLVSRHTHGDTTKRRPRNGTVGPEIAIFTTILGIESDPNSYPKHKPVHPRWRRWPYITPGGDEHPTYAMAALFAKMPAFTGHA